MSFMWTASVHTSHGNQHSANADSVHKQTGEKNTKHRNWACSVYVATIISPALSLEKIQRSD